MDEAVKVRLLLEVPDSYFKEAPLPQVKANTVRYAKQ
jgi:hypothetical protein